jgi:hypothetical protein
VAAEQYEITGDCGHDENANVHAMLALTPASILFKAVSSARSSEPDRDRSGRRSSGGEVLVGWAKEITPPIRRPRFSSRQGRTSRGRAA